MQPNETNLTSDQLQALDLYNSGKTTGYIAKTMGICRQTVWRWRQLPEFQEVHRIYVQDRSEQTRESVDEIMRLSFASLIRELKDTESPHRFNPIETALAVIKMAQPRALLQIESKESKSELSE